MSARERPVSASFYFKPMTVSPFITATSEEISLLKNKIVKLRAKYIQEKNRAQKKIYRLRLEAHVKIYREVSGLDWEK